MFHSSPREHCKKIQSYYFVWKGHFIVCNIQGNVSRFGHFKFATYWYSGMKSDLSPKVTDKCYPLQPKFAWGPALLAQVHLSCNMLYTKWHQNKYKTMCMHTMRWFYIILLDIRNSAFLTNHPMLDLKQFSTPLKIKICLEIYILLLRAGIPE